MLGVRETENAKAFALVALGRGRQFSRTGEAAWLDGMRGMLGWLDANATPGFAGPCWGYPFDVFGKGVDTPAGTPIGVVTAIAGQAYRMAWGLMEEDTHLEQAVGIARFMLSDLPRLPGEDGTYCFAYTPSDRRRVHNASLLVAEHLVVTGALVNDVSMAEAAEPAIQFTLRGQREDGAFPYGAYTPGEPFEAGLQRLVDHHHTGFVLRSLRAIHTVKPSPDVADGLARGFAFYKTLLTDDGMPINEYGRYPVDIHACAEAILCSATFARDEPEAAGMAARALSWTHTHLRNPVDGTPYYRYFPFMTSRICFTRWGLAWMYYTLSEFLFRFDSGESSSG